MKATELRIGNLIFIPATKQIATITAISKLGVFVNDNIIGALPFAEIEPIPLTEEWLLKLGYTKLSNSSFIDSGHGIWICNGLFMCDKNGIVLKHVHQLQNLYFALTNQELTIK